MNRWLLTGICGAVLGMAGLVGSAQADGGRHHRGHGHRDHGHHARHDHRDSYRHHGRIRHQSWDRHWYSSPRMNNYGYYPHGQYYRPSYPDGLYINGSNFSLGIRF